LSSQCGQTFSVTPIILGWEIQSMIHSDATTFQPQPVSPTITVQQSGAALDARADEVIEAS